MNKLGHSKRPFLFVISYDLQNNLILPLDQINKDEIRYDFEGNSTPKNYPFTYQKIAYEKYQNAFQQVKNQLLQGNSFLTNLTVSSPITSEVDLEEVFHIAKSKYKLWIKDYLVCFSPETFVKVNQQGVIVTNPMKGTLDASIENAEELLKNDPKELFEHTTIVDLLRNDLSQIADKIEVTRFQYIDKIVKSNGQEILQMSSEIKGQLPPNWKASLGDWFFKLLPAGSICGAPKQKTLEIIQTAEENLHQRGFYTGVLGIFDGQSLNSGVMIRFIEKNETGYVFKSGGGITHLSDAKKEYEEIYQKLYIPIA